MLRGGNNMSMTRRDFVKCSAAASGLAAGFYPASSHAKTQTVQTNCLKVSQYPINGTSSKVFIEGVARNLGNPLIEKALRNAAESATDFSWLGKGDSVLIKPVNNSGEKYPATTHPESIAFMVKLLREKGAARVIVSDMAGVQQVKLAPNSLKGSTRNLMKKNGILEASLSAGAEMYFPEESGWNAFFEDGPQKGTCWKNGIMVPKILNEVDHIILMPRTSRHAVAGCTLGLKAAVGYIRHDSRLEYHHDASTLFEKHVGINTVPAIMNRLRLVITTATKMFVTFGPDNGKVYEPETGLIIASTDITAHDMVSLAWLEMARDKDPAGWPLLITDPHENADWTVDMMNRAVVYMLGGVGEARSAQVLKRYPSGSIWNDPTLNSAFRVFGSIPDISLLNPTGSVPEDITKQLKLRVSPV
jgi:uncharacterized protein (DUF362 family)